MSLTTREKAFREQRRHRERVLRAARQRLAAAAFSPGGPAPKKRGRPSLKQRELFHTAPAEVDSAGARARDDATRRAPPAGDRA
jgi:hypothetical protein